MVAIHFWWNTAILLFKEKMFNSKTEKVTAFWYERRALRKSSSLPPFVCHLHFHITMPNCHKTLLAVLEPPYICLRSPESDIICHLFSVNCTQPYTPVSQLMSSVLCPLSTVLYPQLYVKFHTIPSVWYFAEIEENHKLYFVLNYLTP